MTIQEKIERFILRNPFIVPHESLARLEKVCHQYGTSEQWDSAYRIATTLVRDGFAEPLDARKIVDGLVVLLRIWNQQYYGPYGFHEDELSEWLTRHKEELIELRKRNIKSFGGNEDDEALVERMFGELLKPLNKNSDKPKQSPISVGKALHLLAPEFLPLWDGAIAWKWRCPFTTHPSIAYIVFCRRIRDFSDHVVNQMKADASIDKKWFNQRTLVKRIDEYNYTNRS